MKKSFCITAIIAFSLAGVAKAGLLGVNVTPPIITYVNTGSLTTSYDPGSQIFTVTTTPSSIKFTPTEPTFPILTPRSMQIRVQVDNSGALIGGVTGPDLVISGRVARIVGGVTNIYTGLLLTGDVTAFGSQDSGTTVDNYDFRFTPTGGALQSFFQCDHIGVMLTSEGSTFTGLFTTNFHGQSKGNVGLEDQTPPTITCPFENISVTNVECSAQGAQAGAYVTFPDPTATDNCGTNVLITCSPTNGSFFALAPGTNMTSYAVTCTARDPSGNTNSCDFFITIEDVLPPDFDSNPVIDACGEAPISLTTDPGLCSATFTFEKPTAMDSCCTSAVPVGVSAIDENGFIIPLTCFTSNSIKYVTGQFPQSCLGSNVITSTANDGRGNSTQRQCAVLVFDNEPPSITCSNNQTVACTNGPVFYEEPVASDNCTNLTVSCTPPNGSLLAVGSYNVTCIASDGCGGNSNSCSFTLNVVDATPPTISCPSNTTVVCSQSTAPSSTGTATASDDCDFNPSVTFTDITSGTCPTVTFRTWFAVDAGGNSNQCTQVITIVDTTPPSVVCPADKQLQCGASTATNNTGAATGSDTCSGVTITYTDVATPANCSGQAGIDRTWKATDGCGNFSTCVQHITFVDTTAPTISCPTDKQLQCGASTATNNTGTVTAGSDNCGGAVTITYTDAATPANCTSKPGVDRTWKATDSCGNFSTCVQHITFVDTTAPTVTVPAGGNLGCNPSPLPTDASVKALVTATDNCSTTSVTVTHVDTTIACTTTSTFTVVVKDTCNNTTTKTVVYTYGCPPCVPFTFNFQGNTALSGAVANVRTFITNGVSVKVTAFSRVKSSGAWAKAYLGSYVGGLGVTDSSEGSGSSNRHTVDNVGRNNYVLFEFSQPVTLNRAYLGYVVTDSDLKLWIGTFTDPYNNHLTLSDAVLSSFGFSEDNDAANNSTRWADVNAGNVMGNAIVIAGSTTDTTPDDYFKIAKFDLCSPICQPLTLACAASSGQVGVAYSSTLVRSGGTSPFTFTIYSGSLPPGLTLNPSTGAITGSPTTAGTYAYTAKVTDSAGQTAFTTGCAITIANPCTGSICGSILRDCDANGNLSGEAGISGVTVKLKNSSGTVVATTTTSSSGSYCFTGLAAGTYTVVVTQPTNYALTAPAGCNNQQTVTLTTCQNKTGIIFGYRGTAPSVSLKKTGVKTSSTKITYTFTVKNTGNTCFYGGMHVDDPKLGGQIFYQSPVSPGQSFTFTKTYTIKSSDPTYITNTATATGHPPTGSAVSVTASCSVHK